MEERGITFKLRSRFRQVTTGPVGTVCDTLGCTWMEWVVGWIRLGIRVSEAGSATQSSRSTERC